MSPTSSHGRNGHVSPIATGPETNGCSWAAVSVLCRPAPGSYTSSPALGEIFYRAIFDTRGGFTRPDLCMPVAPSGETRRLTDRHASPSRRSTPASTDARGRSEEADTGRCCPEAYHDMSRCGQRDPVSVSNLALTVSYILMHIPINSWYLTVSSSFTHRSVIYFLGRLTLRLLMELIPTSHIPSFVMR